MIKNILRDARNGGVPASDKRIRAREHGTHGRALAGLPGIQDCIRTKLKLL